MAASMTHAKTVEQAIEPVLSVRNLVIEVPTLKGATRLVDNLSFDVMPNEVLGIVGESGSGKSLTMLAVMGLLPAPLRMASGEVILRGRKLTGLSFEAMRQVRGKTMSMIFQDPMTSLNPVIRIGSQICEAIRLHNPSLPRQAVRQRAIDLLALVGIPNPERRFRQFPNEFSGGMRQRAMIAIAMANEPDLLIADEPTTALDVTIQAQVMQVLAEVRERTGAAMVLITHDLGLVAETCDRVAVLYGGRMMERSSVATTFADAHHPYTVGLIASLPRVDRTATELYSIPGQVPDLSQRPPGCVFHPRCGLSHGRAPCREQEPEFRPIEAGHDVACHFAEETPAWAEAENRRLLEQPPLEAGESAETEAETVLKVQNLGKNFQVRRSSGWGVDQLRAVREMSFELRKGSTIGLVGESGCGKSTLGRVILRLLDATSGAVYLKGDDIARMSPRQLREKRREMQVVFQDPYASLDPRMTVHEIIAEPLRINGCYDPARVAELLGHVGLPPESARRRPPEFSGGQRQRVAIARALALRPELMVLDEAVSALDVSIQAQVVNLLKSLQNKLGVAFLFISHDLSVVRHISDQVAVMYLGKLVEFGSRDQIFDRPAHPYTQALLSAIPKPDPSAAGKDRIVLSGDLPNPLNPPSGCPFRTRCRMATDLCAAEDPDLRENTGPGHLSACHYAAEAASSIAAAAEQENVAV